MRHGVEGKGKDQKPYEIMKAGRKRGKHKIPPFDQ